MITVTLLNLDYIVASCLWISVV